MVLFEREPRETARSYARRILLYNIVHLELEPGCMMSEVELAEEIQLSRTPVREALMELSKDQLVEILPQRGSRVALINYDLVEEARFLRLVLENAIVKLACERENEFDFSKINENLAMQKWCLENDVVDRLMVLDNEFHQEYFRLCNKLSTFRLMHSMTAHFNRVRMLAVQGGAVRDNQTVDDHFAIADAVYHREAQKAQALMTEHLSRYKIDAITLKQQFPQYFVKSV